MIDIVFCLYFKPLSSRDFVRVLSSAVETVIYVYICTACLHYYKPRYHVRILSCRSQLDDENSYSVCITLV